MKIFDEYVDKMRLEYLPRLTGMNAVSVADLNHVKLPEAGVYVLYDEEDKPLYAGRTNRLKVRLKQHSHENSSHYSASFAFLLAREKAQDSSKRSRAVLAADPAFKFKEAKDEVRSMRFRCVLITDPIEQALFEMYAAIELKTPYNFFDTH